MQKIDFPKFVLVMEAVHSSKRFLQHPGQTLPVVWVQGSDKSTMYPEQALKGTVSTGVRGVATRRGY